MCKKIIITLFTFVIVFGVFGQRKPKSEVLKSEISGVLQDIQGNPVEGATISTDEGRIFTISNKAGSFKLKVMVNSRILIEKSGFESKYLSLADLGEVILLDKTPFLSGSQNKVILPFGFTPFKKNVVNSSYTIRSADFSEIDRNLHVNNTRYVAWCVDAAHAVSFDDGDIIGIDICYYSEIRFSERVLLFTRDNGDIFQVDGVPADSGKPAFSAILYRDVSPRNDTI